ncbi:MAG: hypothetical protein C4287_23255 [Leptolyngbya sp. ERB_1_2]
MNNWWSFHLAYVVWACFQYWHVRYLLEGPFYGESIGRSLISNVYGFLHVPRMIAFICGASAVMILAACIEPVYGCVLPVIDCYATAIRIRKHLDVRSVNRKKQIELLRKLRAFPPEKKVSIGVPLITRHDIHFFEYFAWMYEMSPSPAEAEKAGEIERVRDLLTRRLQEWAQRPQEEWFPV